MLAFPIAYKTGSANPETFTSCQSATDSTGHGWTLITGSAFLVGSIAQIIPGGPPYSRLIFGPGAMRGVVPGDLSAGDTLTFTWNAPDPAKWTNGAMVFAFTNLLPGAADQALFLGDVCHIEYGNGDGYPENGGSSTTLNWALDIGSDPAPCSLVAAVTVSAISPSSSGYAPASGAKIGELGGSGWAMAVTLDPAIARGALYEPGGAWPDIASMLIGNYQFADIKP